MSKSVIRMERAVEVKVNESGSILFVDFKLSRPIPYVSLLYNFIIYNISSKNLGE